MDKTFKINVGFESDIYDDHICECGESPLWHPLRKQLYWVDITTHEILTHQNGRTQRVPFYEFVTALAWIDANNILVATETGLVKLNLDSFDKTEICSLEADSSKTRSNDGRADAWGGFWISTMGKRAERGAGKIYRYHQGHLSVIVDNITIPNAICFSPCRKNAYFADTATKRFYKIRLNPETGEPVSPPELFIDFEKTGHAIDGAIVDQMGHIFFGVWDGYAIIKVSPNGDITESYPVSAARPTCPAFGGEDFKDIYITTAAIGLHATLDIMVGQGRTLLLSNIADGQPEPQVRL